MKKFGGMKENDKKNVLDNGMENSLKNEEDMKQMQKTNRIEHETRLNLRLYLHMFKVVHISHENKAYVCL